MTLSNLLVELNHSFGLLSTRCLAEMEYMKEFPVRESAYKQEIERLKADNESLMLEKHQLEEQV